MSSVVLQLAAGSDTRLTASHDPATGMGATVGVVEKPWLTRFPSRCLAMVIGAAIGGRALVREECAIKVAVVAIGASMAGEAERALQWRRWGGQWQRLWRGG